VAHDSGNREMLSAQRIGEFRDRIMTSVELGCKRLREDIEKDRRGSGREVSEAQLQALLDDKQYEQLGGRVLDVANDELGVLEAEGNVLPDVRVPNTQAPQAALTPKSEGRKRGAKPVTADEAQHVADIVQRLAPDGNWRSKLEDVRYALSHGICNASEPEDCDLSDHEKITLPRGWKKNKRDWLTADKDILVKAIEERLKRAPGKFNDEIRS
jgi:hypothetical protein